MRTHYFLLEARESLYRFFLAAFLTEKSPPGFLSYVSEWLKSFPTSNQQQSTHRNLVYMLEDIKDKYNNFPNEFQLFMKQKYDTWKFWTQFVFKHFFPYTSLYLARRIGCWKLRLASIKSMVALFTAFDRPKYAKLIPQHLLDMLSLYPLFSGTGRVCC